MPSRQDSVSLPSLNSPPSHSRLVFPLASQSPSISMHDPHPSQQSFDDYQPNRFHVDHFSVVPASGSSQLQGYGAHPSPQASIHSVGGHHVGAGRPKRKQVKNACSACQRACKRCDVGRPCERCVKYGMGDSCRDSQRKERKKGVKRGPYKKRDGEYPVPTPSSVADAPPPGMLNELQRMSVAKSRTSRVSSVSEPPSQPSTSASVSQLDQSTPTPVQMYVQPVPSVRPTEGSFPYSTAVMVPAHAHPQSLASMHSNPSTSHASLPHQSSRDEDQYYQPRYDNLAHGSTRSGQFRMDSSVGQQDYQTRHISHMVDQRNARTLQYPSPENSPPRDRQYSTPSLYNDNHHRHDMIQNSAVHHDASYQSQSDSTHENPAARTVDVHYPYANQQHQHHQRSYSNDVHMSETHSHAHSQQQEMQQPHQQQQQQQYYSAYNGYQSQQPTNYASHTYDYSQNHSSQVLAPNQHVSEQTGSAYLNRMAPDQVSYASGSSINAYPTHQPHPVHHTMSNGVQYPMRTAGRVVHRDMDLVAHQHAGNVQIPSN
ncbi:hypothetical protein BDV93DRAFT_517170 [Ceratobasidium sp. AG-I]|nr:hypothetical protein BDV93DRAFT_517170 [Ceratobasidium sp. AG-I]